MMDYTEYVRVQTEVHGQIVKPIEYHLAERSALGRFFGWVHREARILDVGCGIGLGMAYLERLGFTNVHGIELNQRKGFVGRCFGLDIIDGDITNLSIIEPQSYDVIYCSHAFEHMLNPGPAIEAMRIAAKDRSLFFFILPYPDTGDPTAHCASNEIGLRRNDEADTLVKWFREQGLRPVWKEFHSEREPEVWLHLVNMDEKAET